MPPSGFAICTDPVFISRAGLIWSDGMGWYPIHGSPYNEDYWAKYEGYAQTDMGRALNDARIAFAERHCGDTVDIGIGCGQFVEGFGCKGYDINPVGVKWLQARGLWHDPYLRPIESATFWDSLEHIPDIHRILPNITDTICMTVPIFRDKAHALSSKHFRPDEHCWYFTHDGLLDWMEGHGFYLLEHTRMEEALGREDVGTYAFSR